MRILAVALFIALGLTTASATAAPSNAGRTEFEVLRNGQPFGRHAISVSGSGDALRAQSEVALRVNFGPVTAFHYEQTCDERWRGGALVALTCSTLKNGRRVNVQAEAVEGRLRVDGAGGDQWFPLGAFPSSWWTRPPADADSLINTETGERMAVRITRMGRETILVGGERISAERIRVEGTLAVDLWYDDHGRWVGCAFSVRGQNVVYRLASPRSAGPA